MRQLPEIVSKPELRPGDKVDVSPSTPTVFEGNTPSTKRHAPGRMQLKNVGKQYSAIKTESVWVVRHVTLDVEPGEFITVIGPSGSGKTTLLRMIAGIVTPNEGEVLYDGIRVAGPGPDRIMVFQSSEDSLFEWLTVLGNVEFGPQAAKLSKDSRLQVARSAIALVGLEGHEYKFPHQLSGGMKQRLQIARALALRPQLLVMDEPLASLDAQTRRILLREFTRIWSQISATIVYVTHDIREAVLLGQRIVVISRGPAATIRAIYPNPVPYPRDEFHPAFIELYRTLDKSLADEVGEQW